MLKNNTTESPSVVKFFFFRHGETSYNAAGLIQGSINNNLNFIGVQQAIALSKQMKDKNFDTVLSSSLQRAISTAEYAMGNKLNIVNFITSPALQEMSFGVYEGATYADFERDNAEVLQILDDVNHPDTFNAYVEGGESHQDVLNRVFEFLTQIATDNANTKNVAVFAHGGVMRILYKYLAKEIKSFKNCEALTIKF